MMKKQQTFTDIKYSCRKKKTRREEYLEIMDEIMPWEEWVGVIAPHYPSGKQERPPSQLAQGGERSLADARQGQQRSDVPFGAAEQCATIC